MPSDIFRVTATTLNLRSEPKVRPGNRLAVLPHLQVVQKLSDSIEPGWWRISTQISGAEVTGFVAKSFLEPEVNTPPASAASGLRAVHMQENRADVTRNDQSKLAYPLGEPGRPGRDSTELFERVQQLLAIIDYLSVDTSARYQKRNNDTFCNIYATDYCYLAGVYLPRVWWTGAAIERLAGGEAVPVQYGETVGELNANSLLGWLKDFGARFGWKRTFSDDVLQDAADQGQVALIVAQRVALNLPGHIAVVPPENGPNQSIRDLGWVKVPLTSQAGAENFRFGTALGRWWTGSKYREFGYYIHD